MPTYSYRCSGCDTALTVRQSMFAEPPRVCSCGGALRRIFEPPAVSFRGLGFARNDDKDLLSTSFRSDVRAISVPMSHSHERAGNHRPGDHHGLTADVARRINDSVDT